MSLKFFGKEVKLFEKRSVKSQKNTQVPTRYRSTSIFNSSTHSTIEEAKEIPEVTKLLDKISSQLATLPIESVFTGEVEPETVKQIVDILNNQPNPNPGMTPFLFKKALIEDYLMHGKAFIRPFHTEDSIEFYHLPVEDCQIRELVHPENPLKRSLEVIYRPRTVGGYVEAIELYDDEIVGRELISIFKEPQKGANSKGILYYASKTFKQLRFAKVLENEIVEAMAEGASVIVIEDSGEFAPNTEELNEFKKRMAVGSNGKHEVISTTGRVTKIDLRTEGLTQELFEYRKTLIRELTAHFGVDAAFALADDNKYNRTYEASFDFNKEVLSPIVKNFEEALTNALVRDFNASLRFDTDFLNRLDPVALTKDLNERVKGGLITRNEGRVALGYDKSELTDMDAYSISIGTALLGTDGSMKLINMAKTINKDGSIEGGETDENGTTIQPKQS